MGNRVASCPQAKQIVGSKGWLGYVQQFSFPGFKGNWAGGAWTDSADGGAVGSGEPNFAVGDLVLVEFAAVGPVTDYLTGLSQSYPKYWQVYICQAAITGSATSPASDTTHFKAWDFQNFTVSGATLTDPNGLQPVGGPSGWPISMGGRLLGSSITDTAQLELTITTELDNFPLYPATISGLTAALGSYNDTAGAFVNPTTSYGAAAGGTFAYDWTIPANYDGTAATYTPPGTAPATNQAPFIFPSLPANEAVGYGPTGHYDGGGHYILDTVFFINPGPYPVWLVSWSFSSSSISFEFAAWSYEPDVEFSLALGHYGDIATAPGTITQTITLGGASYTLAEVAAQATALMNATTFDSIAWGTSWTNTYNTSGAVVSTQNFSVTLGNSITAACAVGTPVKWGVAVNGSPFSPGDFPYTMSKALVDVCGNYCQRTYNCPTVTCASGNVDGYDPVELDPPGTPGQSAAIYASCTCT